MNISKFWMRNVRGFCHPKIISYQNVHAKMPFYPSNCREVLLFLFSTRVLDSWSFDRNRPGDLRTDGPALWTTKLVLHRLGCPNPRFIGSQNPNLHILTYRVVCHGSVTLEGRENLHGLVVPLCGTSWDKLDWDRFHRGHRACPATRRGLQRRYMTCPWDKDRPLLTFPSPSGTGLEQATSVASPLTLIHESIYVRTRQISFLIHRK